MKRKNIQQEVLLFTQTTFAQNVLIRHGADKRSCSAEELEKGLWDGLLNEMLPELMIPMHGRPSGLFIWQINFGEFLLSIDMAETLDIMEDSYSINPSCFLSLSKMN